MTNTQYNAALTIFFVSYAVFEPLTNVLLKRMRPSIVIYSDHYGFVGECDPILSFSGCGPNLGCVCRVFV